MTDEQVIEWLDNGHALTSEVFQHIKSRLAENARLRKVADAAKILKAMLFSNTPDVDFQRAATQGLIDAVCALEIGK